MWRGIVCSSVMAGSLALVGLGAANAPQAGEEGPFMRPHPHGPLARLISGKVGRLMVLRSELGVTDEQRTQFIKLAKEHRGDVGPKLAAAHKTMRGLRDAVLADDASEAQIRKAADAHGQAVAEAAIALSKVAKEGKQVLSETQRGQVRKFVADNDAAHDKLVQEWKARAEKLP